MNSVRLPRRAAAKILKHPPPQGWGRCAEPLDMWGTAGPPSYGTVWGLLARIDASELGKAIWGEEAS